MDFWAGLAIGVISSVVVGGLALFGVILTNRAAQRRDETAVRETRNREDSMRRANREHELRNALRALTAAIRRYEVRYNLGLIASSEIRLDAEVSDVIWRLSRLRESLGAPTRKQFELAQAQIEVGFVEDGVARYDEIVRTLEDWAVMSDRELLFPTAPRKDPDGFRTSASGG